MKEKDKILEIMDYDITSPDSEMFTYEENDEELELAGYHATFYQSYIEIRKSGKFQFSNQRDDWLGEGAYFWTNMEDGRFWTNVMKYRNLDCKKAKDKRKVIIECSLKCRSSEYFDLDINMEKLEQFREELLQKMESSGTKIPLFKNNNERKCYYCNEYKEAKGIKVMSFSFPVLIYNELGFPVDKKKRKQICVSDNDCIHITNCINVF